MKCAYAPFCGMCLRIFTGTVYVQDVGKGEVSSLAEKVSTHLRVHSQSILGLPGKGSDRSLSGSEGTRGQNTRRNVWGKAQRPNENGTYSLRPRSTDLLQELGRGFRFRKTTSKNERRQVKELLGNDLCSQKT